MSTIRKKPLSTILIALAILSVIITAVRIHHFVEAAACPAVLQSSITTLVELDANDYIGDNVIDCSTVDIHIASGGTLRILPKITDNDLHADDYGLIIRANSVTVDEGGVIDLEGTGYGPGQQVSHIGSGKSSVSTCPAGVCGGSGGGHGGAGGRGDPDGLNEAGNPGQSYGSSEGPVTLGSGGGESAQALAGGAGGGALKLEVTEVFTLNGIVNADGADGAQGMTSGGGGGAGGSFWVEAGSFAGIGLVTAEGGDGGVPVGTGGTGGGGGGGRVVMRCTVGNTFSGSISVAPGEGNSNDGQVGTKIEPSCYPNSPTSLLQYGYNSHSNPKETLVADGSGTNETAVRLKFTISDVETSSSLTPQVEVREVGQPFTGTPTHSGSPVAYSGTPVQTYIQISNLIKAKDYKWQARVRDAQGAFSPWVEYEEGEAEEVDLILYGDPVLMQKISGDNQTGTVGSQITNPFIIEIQDQAGHPLPGVTLTWQVKTGGGTLSIYNATTNTTGRAETYLTLGTVSGTDTNTVDAVRTGLTGSPARFTASADPGQIDHYDIDLPSIAITSVNFDPPVLIQAKDTYGNLVSSAVNDIYLDAVDPTTHEPFLDGDLLPDQATLVAGEVTISNMTYSVARNIKVTVWDTVDMVDNNKSFSSVLSVVNSLGDCFGRPNLAGTLIIDESEIHNAADYPGGIINCSEVDVEIRQGLSGTVVTLNSNDNGDTVYPAGDYGVTILANSLEVESGAKLNLNGTGYLPARGPGAGNMGTSNYPAGGGGAHGGYGSWGLNGPGSSGNPSGGSPNGDVFEPLFLGSGGGDSGGRGGGALKIVIDGNHVTHPNSDKLVVDGEIDLDGQPGIEACPEDNTNCGGGAGGSFWAITAYLEGSGSIHANGGIGRNGGIAGHGGGGSGGRISVEYEDKTGFTGYLYAHGADRGDSGDTAGPGTIYLEETDVHSDQHGNLYVDNDGKNTLNAGVMQSSCPDGPAPGHGGCMFNQIVAGVDMNGNGLHGYGHVDFLGTGSALTVSSSTITGDGTSDIHTYGITYIASDPYTISLGGLHIRGDITGYSGPAADLDLVMGNTGELGLYANTPWRSGSFSFNSVSVQNTGDMTLVSYNNGDSNYDNDYGVTLNVVDLQVDMGGEISADGKGYAVNQGPGTGSGYGAGHGGYGGNGAAIYGSLYEPIDLGSGGEAGAGGGAVKLSVSNTATVNGDIHSSGTSEGSGGSIWIDTNVLTGGTFGVHGKIYANGGSSSGADGGGAGRIAIYYTEASGFDGSVFAHGGGNGGPGTVYWEQKGVDAAKTGSLFVDNNGVNQRHAGITEAECLETAPPTYGCRFKQITLGADLDGNGAHGYGHLDLEGMNSKLTLTSTTALTGDDTSKLDIYGLMNFDFDPPTDPVIIEHVDVGIYGNLTGVYDLTLRNNGKMTLNGWTARRSDRGITPVNEYSFNDISVENTGILNLKSYDSGDTDWENDYPIVLNFDTLSVAETGLVSGDGHGYTATHGPGHGNYSCGFWCGGSGASFGGYGASSTVGHGGANAPENPFGNIYDGGASMGSGGGNGGAGGSGMSLIGQTLVLDGIISSNGAIPANYGGGSGGGITIDVTDLESAGTGVIRANGAGGPGDNGDGSGGRISLYFSQNDGFALDATHLQ
ncbi:MAG: hypothetical protein PHG63_02440, partial [Candidatus Dojkabacteria bacterium]|nr:hypothetical protein [Candidatus Dojkabacteria bacterium]